MNNLPADIGVFNDKCQYIFVNESGIKDPELRNWLIGKTDFDYCNYRNIPTSKAEERFENFVEAFKGNKVEYVEEIKMADGNSKFLLRIIYPLKENNTVKYLIGYGIDVTSIKKAEKQKDVHLKHLEEIAFATSHKIRQPLVNLQGIFNMIESGNVEPDEMPQLMQLMKESLGQMDKLTKEMGKNLHQYKNQLLPEEVKV